MSPIPTREEQELEARNREVLTDGGERERDPHQTPINDNTGEEGDQIQRQPERREEPEERNEPVEKDRRTPSDIARAEMAERFKRQRLEKEGDVPYNGNPNDPEMQYGRAGRPADQEPDDGSSAVGSRTDGDSQPEPAQRQAEEAVHTITVRGKPVQLTTSQLLERASKVEAADSYLEESRDLLEQAKDIRRTNAASPDHQHPDGRSRQQDDGLNGDADDTSTAPDELVEAIENIQFGDPKEAAEKLRKVLTKTSDESADKRQLTRLMNNELTKSQKVLKDFTDRNPDIRDDPNATAVVLNYVYDVYREDLAKAGIAPEQMPKNNEELANWHRFSRVHGQDVTPIDRVFEEARSRYNKWRGVSSGAKPAAQQQGKQAPRVEVNVDRTARREAIPVQPTRTVSPRPDATRPQPQAKTRSDVVMNMRKSRGQVV